MSFSVRVVINKVLTICYSQVPKHLCTRSVTGYMYFRNLFLSRLGNLKSHYVIMWLVEPLISIPTLGTSYIHHLHHGREVMQYYREFPIEMLINTSYLS